MQSRASNKEQNLRFFGQWLVTPFFALGSAVITTVAFSSLSIITGLALPWLIPILMFVFLAETAISIYLFKNSVPDTLVDIFVKNIFHGLSVPKQILLALGIFSALGGGLALSALTYISGVSAVSAVLSLFSLTCPPLGIAIAASLALVGFIAFSSLLLKWIAVAIKHDMHIQALHYFKEIFTRDIKKPLGQQVLEGIFKLTFVSFILAITVVGTIATLGTMQKGLIQFFSLIPHANTLAVQITSGIIAYAMMGSARLPFALQSVCSVFSTIGEAIGRTLYYSIFPQPTLTQPKTGNHSWEKIGIALLKTSAVVIHGISFGALAKSGGGKVLSNVMTDLHIPLSPTTLDVVGESASIATGGMMAAGIGAFSIFSDTNKQPTQNPTSNTGFSNSAPSFDLSNKKYA